MRSKFLWAALALVAVLVITTAASATTRGLIHGKQIAPHAINSKHLVNHTIQAHDLSKKAIASFSVNHAKYAADAIWADAAGTADWATEADNATALGGIPASGYVRSDCNTMTGQIKAFALINDANVSTTTLSTAGVEAPYNCSGGQVLAMRIATGKYEVLFVGGPAAIAFATAEEVNGSPTFHVNSASVNRISGGHYYVQIWNEPLGDLVNGSFSIWSP